MPRRDSTCAAVGTRRPPPGHGSLLRPVAILAFVGVVVAGCTATDDGTRVRDVDGAGVPLEESS